MEIKTILITGGTGFLGSHIINSLSSKYLFLVFVRKNSNKSKIEPNKNVKFYFSLERAFKEHNVDCVLHLATVYGRKQESDLEMLRVNVLLPVELVNLATSYKVNSFVNIDTFLHKQTNSYSLSKAHAVEWLRRYRNQISIFNLKTENIYGENDDLTKFIPWIINEIKSNRKEIALTKGDQKRDFIYVEDMVEIIRKIIENSLGFGHGFYEYEVGSGNPMKIKEVALFIKQEIGNNEIYLNFGALKKRKNEPKMAKPRISKLKKDFNWSPSTGLRDGLKKTIGWYLKND